jgi:ABC-type branched-subunit amino acid transport system ATPase component
MSAPAAVRVEGLTKHYGGVRALDGVDLQVEAGEVYGLIGPNGAGKSTLVDVASGFAPPTSGAVYVDDQVVTGRKPHELARRGITRTFQHTSVFEGATVRHNLEVAAVASRTGSSRWSRSRGAERPDGSVSDRVRQVLEDVGLLEVADAQAESLPYGDQRRLEVAIALVVDPSVLILDEPAAGMNPVESADFVALVGRVRKGRTVLLIEHDMAVVRALCERTSVLVDGTVLISGRTDEVLSDERVIEVYLGVPA